ncbi:MAG: DHH family protein [Clostridia bacterium]|nr:DHH family protein [Clostridia bacterium]
MMGTNDAPVYVVTAGSSYLDIDAYACCAAMKELLGLQHQKAVAYSSARPNYSVCGFLKARGHIETALPEDIEADTARYVVVDISDPRYLQDDVPADKVAAVYDHHVGFEAYWKDKIGRGTHIEFIGAAATLVYREWKKAGLQSEMMRDTALLLIAAILDNTLDLTSGNTTSEDIEAYRELCAAAGVGDEWRAVYFSAVQSDIEADLKNALLNDVKALPPDSGLPDRVAQIAVWDAHKILEGLNEIRGWLDEPGHDWMLNVIDIGRHTGYFVCDDTACQEELARRFGASFENGVAELPQPYLRKEIIKRFKD